MDEPKPRTKADTYWLAAFTAVVVLTGMAYSLWWPALVRHQSSYWTTPGDLWFTVRTAHWIGWGSFSYVYSNSRSALVTLPGFELLFTPLVMLSSALHLSEVAPGLLGPLKPTAWLLVGPSSLACSGLPLFALDSLARRLGVVARRRRLLSAAEMAALWPVIALWGHPEDAIAIGLAVYVLLMLLDERWTAAGWLLGAALVTQLLVVMLVPVFIGLVGWQRAKSVLARASVLPGFLLVAVLVPDFHAAFWVLANQPSDPTPNHVTPWIALARKLDHRPLVSGGLGHLLNGGVAVGAGFLAHRWRRDVWRIVWLAALVLAARTVFEAVMVPYYVMPGLALALVTGSRNALRWLGACVAGAGLTVMTFTHHGRWEYWLAMTGLTVAVLWLAWPARGSRAAVAPDVPESEEVREAPAAALLLTRS
jgi:hypothetical protein